MGNRSAEVMVGKRYGSVIVQRMYVKGNHRVADCQCDCGKVATIQVGTLFRTKWCSRRCSANPSFLGGMSRHPIHVTWGNMIARCHNPKNKRYADYGGRGIVVADEWHKAKPFIEWALANGWQSGLQIDRIDNDGPYCPSNCQFVTPKENMAKRRNSVVVQAFGESKVATAWAEDSRCVVSMVTLSCRLLRGWESERAITTPKHEPASRERVCPMCGLEFVATQLHMRACSLSCGLALSREVRLGRMPSMSKQIAEKRRQKRESA